MQEKLLSVIIPAYNLEKYIEECVNSVRNQTYENLQIIIVDDGSVDGTFDICNRIAEEDERVIVVSQENAGVTMARRKGLSLAQGEHVTFVDGDDYIEPEMYSCMMRNIEDYDLVVCGYFHHLSDGRVEIRHDDFEGEYRTKEAMECVWKKMVYNIDKRKINSIRPALWNKIYRKDMAQKIMALLDAELFYAEDAVFLYQYILQCKSIIFLKKAFYHYRFREESVCHSKNEKMLENTNRKYLSLKKAFSGHYMERELISQLQKRTVDTAMNILNNYMGFSINYRVPRFVVDVSDLKDCRIVLYGAGQMGQDVMVMLINNHVTTIAWVDKNYQYLRRTGLDVDDVDVLDGLEFDVLLIAVSDEMLMEEIKREIIQKGISEDKIVWKKPIVTY